MNDSTVYLERALIGGLLMYPERRHEARHLTSLDFTDPTCHASWNLLILNKRTTPDPVNVLDIANELAAIAPDLHPRLRSAAAIAELQAEAPARPHIDSYAALMIDATTRREALAIGRRLAQVNAADPQQFTLESLSAQTRLARLADRLGDQTPPTLTLPQTPRGYAHVPPARTAATGRPVPTWADLSVLAAAIHDYPRGARDRALTSIQASDLESPAARAAWAAVDSLRPSAIAIDEVTTYWQLGRSPAGQDGLGLHRLRGIRNLGLVVYEAITEIHDRTTRRTQNTLRNLVTSPTLTERPTRALVSDLTQAVKAAPPPPLHPGANRSRHSIG